MNRRLYRALLAIAAAALFQIGLSSRETVQSQSVQRRLDIDAVFAGWDRRGSPGCALGVYKDGRILYERGYGMADLEHNAPITPETPFYIGSVSKQFTAFAAALAIQQGKIGADDSIRKYFPELPEYAGAITVRQLVHHTSGLRDFYTLLAIAGRRQDFLYTNLDVLRLAARQKALNFEPGTDYLYSNTGYALLALLVGRATGSSFGAFAEANIFKPLGMASSHVHDNDTRLVPGRAFGYSEAAGTWRLDTPAGERVGAGGVFSTVRDLLKWDENFYTAKVGGRALIDQVQTPGALSGGKPLTYAWGMEIGSYRGQRIVEHGGSLGGYRAHLMRFPDQHTTVACLCNLGSITPGTLARRVADLVIGSSLGRPVTATSTQPGAGRGGPGPSAVPSGPYSSGPSGFGGRYYSDEIDATFVITPKGEQLLVQRETDSTPTTLQRVSADEFRFGGMTLRFVRDASGNPEALLVDAGRVRNIRFQRTGFQAPAQVNHVWENQAIVRALLRDMALPERDRLMPANAAAKKVYLAEETLAACPPRITGPCITDDVFKRAELEAGKGAWRDSLTSLFESINGQSQRLEDVDHAELVVGPRADWAKAYLKTTTPLSISTPAVLDDQALVYVQFGQSSTWFVLLSKREGAWAVTKKMVLGAS